MFTGFSGTTLHFCYGYKSHPTTNSPLVLPRCWHSTASARKHMSSIGFHCRLPSITSRQGSDTLKLWRGHINPNVQFSSKPVFFNRWLLNDYICSLESCVVTSFGDQITRVTLNNLKSCLSHHVAGHHCQVPQVFISHTICPHIPGDFLAQAT